MSVERRVKEIIIENFDGVSEEDIKAESHFIDDLGADSISTIELIQAIEDEFGFDIPDEDGEKLTTVGAAIEYVESKIA